MNLRCVALGAAMLFATSCGIKSDGPPRILVDHTACSHCGMLISEPIYAAAYQSPGAAPRVFDDLGCLRHAAREEHADLRVWVHDAATGEWMDGNQAIFVSSPAIPTPMAGGLLAYRHADDAERASAKYKGRIVRSLSSLLATKEASS
jgi:copper chaperone NosL